MSMNTASRSLIPCSSSGLICEKYQKCKKNSYLPTTTYSHPSNIQQNATALNVFVHGVWHTMFHIVKYIYIFGLQVQFIYL